MQFSGKTVVVTGAGSGIGAAAAQLFLEQGAEVVAIQNTAPAEHGTRRVRMNLCDAASIAGFVAADAGLTAALHRREFQF